MKTILRIVSVLAATGAAAAGIASSLHFHRAGAELHAGALLYETSLQQKDEAGAASFRKSAAEALERAAALDPGDPDPPYYLGRIAARDRRSEDAAVRLRASLRANPFDGRVHYYLGMALAELGRRDEAGRTMETAASLSRNNPGHLYWIGYYFWNVWEKLGRVQDLQKTFQYFRQAAEGDLAYLDRALKVLEEFSLRYENLVQVIPDTPEAHAQAGRYLGHSRGLWEPALAEFLKAGAALENRPDFLLDRGLALLFTGGDHRPDLRRGVDASPDRKAVVRRLAYYFRAARRARDGLVFWVELEEAYPELAAPVLSRAETELEQARTRLEPEMKKLSEDRAAALSKAASPAERKGIEDDFTRRGASLWTEALRGTERHLREKVEALRDPDLRRALADVLVCQARMDEAESCLRLAAETGGSASYWKDLVEFLLYRGKNEDAWNMALEGRRRFPDDPRLDALVKRAQDLMLSGRSTGGR